MLTVTCFINKHKRSHMISMVSPQHFFILTSRKMKRKKGKSSLSNVSIWKKITFENDQKNGSLFCCCFREDKLDVVLCVKASKFMHTREHTHSFSSTDWVFSSFWGDEVKEHWNLLVLLYLLPVYFYSVISYISQNDLTTAWEFTWTFT